MGRKSKYADDYVRGIVEKANECKSNKERAALLKLHNLRIDNLRRLARVRGLTLNEPEPVRARRLRRAANKRWRKMDKKGKRHVRPSTPRTELPLIAKIGSYLQAIEDKNKLTVRKAILQLEIVLDGLRKSVE